MITSNLSKTSAEFFVGIVTLTTDLGLKDYYVASLKGALLSACDDLQIIDVSHEVRPFDILDAAIILKHCYRDFPEGSIHIVGVNPDASSDTRHLVVHIHRHYFIIPDNGIFSLLFDSKADAIVEINMVQQSELLTFPAKDIYVKAACHIHRGGSLQVIGKEITDPREMVMLRASFDEKVIRGSVIYIDHYGNVLTNIDRNLFNQFSKFPLFNIELKSREYEIRQISSSYTDVPGGEKLALFNTLGLMEIAINQGSASSLLGLKKHDIIRIEFHDH